MLDYYESITNYSHANDYVTFLVFFYLCAIPALWAVWNGLVIIRAINRNKIFEASNAKRMRNVAWCAAVISAVCVVFSFLIDSFFLPVVAAVFFVIFLLLLVVAEVFIKAVNYKEENELTI